MVCILPDLVSLTCGSMSGPRLLGRAASMLESFCGAPAFCSVARRSAQASTSGAEALTLPPRQGSRSHGCFAPSGSISEQTHVGRRGQSVSDALRCEQWRQPARLVSTAACPAALLGGTTLSHSLSGSHSGRVLQHQQQRTAFGLPNLNGDSSKHYQERRLIGYSQDQLYGVVAAVEHYREFVPWCQRSEIIQNKPPTFVEAELEVGFKMFVERYTSQVHLTPPGKVVSHVYDSTLFDHLDSTWEFKPGPLPNSTWLSFSVDFAFKSPLYHHIASIFFDEVVKRMMGAFEARCQHLYGASAFSKGQPAQKQKLQSA